METVIARQHCIIKQLLELQDANIAKWLAEQAGRKPQDCPRNIRNAGWDLEQATVIAIAAHPAPEVAAKPKIMMAQAQTKAKDKLLC